jgi:hypothetical protein
MNWSLALSYTVFLLFGPSLSAAEGNSRDPQSVREPENGPGDGQKFLKKLAGDWNVVKKFYPRSGNPVEVMGHCRQVMIHDGRFLQCDFVFQQNGKSVTGLSIVGFDPDTQKFTSFWTDSRSTRISIRQSAEPFDGKTLILHGRELSPGKPDRSESTTESRLEDGGKKIVPRPYVVEPGKERRVIMELTLTR